MDCFKRQVEITTAFVNEMHHIHVLSLAVGKEYGKAVAGVLSPDDGEGHSWVCDLTNHFPIAIIDLKLSK